jgi:CubicO group peptidase (beta-lactamase class C family)
MRSHWFSFRLSQGRWLPVALGFVAALTLIGIVLLRAPHLIPTFVYQFADVDDANIFANRTVEPERLGSESLGSESLKSGQSQPWRIADHGNKAPSPDLIREIERHKTLAYLVVQNGTIVYERYWNGFDQGSISNSFSMAKSIVGLLIGCALSDGSIRSLEQPVGDFLPEFKLGAKAKIRVLDVLTMASGLDWNENYINPFSQTAELYYGDHLRAQVTNLAVQRQAGMSFAYSSADTQILGLVLEAATGQRLSDYASQKLWKPLGAQHPALWSLDRKDGTEKAYCCFHATARDFARLGQLVLQHGRWNDRQIIAPDYIDRATTSSFETVRDADLILKNAPGFPALLSGYGYQFWLTQTRRYPSQRLPTFAGHLGQFIFVVPAQNAVVVRLGLLEDSQGRDVAAYVDAAFQVLN